MPNKKSGPGPWKRFRYRLEYVGVLLLFYLVPLLPRKLAHWCADGLGSVYYLVDAKARRVAESNLASAFGDKYTPAERRRIARASICNMAKTFFDLFWVRNLDKSNFRDYILSDTFERFDEVPEQSGLGAIFFCLHFGNWEWMGQIGGFLGQRFYFVAQEFKNSLLDDIFRRLREHSGCTQVARQGALLKLVRGIKSKISTGIIIDLTVPPQQASIVIDAFGKKMCVTNAAAALHKRLGCALVPCCCIRQPDGSVRTEHFEPLELSPEATEQEITQACWDRLEPYVRQYPEQWIWVYKHWRYRPADAAVADYPFYANTSKAFDQLLADR